LSAPPQGPPMTLPRASATFASPHHGSAPAGSAACVCRRTCRF
jgi:hypothetical protein